MQRAQGDLVGALAAFRQSLTIREKLTRQDPSNAQWEADMVVSLVRISTVFDPAKPEGRATAREALQQALAIAQRIHQSGGFTDHGQKGWVGDLERRLKDLEGNAGAQPGHTG